MKGENMDATSERKTKKVGPVGLKTTGQKQKRICLKCGKKFPSIGPYNRLCDKCSSMNERVTHYASRVAKFTLKEDQDDRGNLHFYEML